MKIAIYQTNPTLLDVQTNLEEIIDKINHGRENGAHLSVFPELALTGYFVGPKYHEAALRMDSKEIRRLTNATKGTGAVVGFIEESSSMNFYNSALVAIDGKAMFAYRKLNLPNYGVFEERKCFSNGKQVKVFQYQGLNIAVFICNDLWHPSLPYLAVCQKADTFITILNSTEDALSSEFSNIESWEIINKFYARVFGIYILSVNRVGKESINSWEDQASKAASDSLPNDPDTLSNKKREYKFWGGSEMINPYGQQIYKAKYDQPDDLIGYIEKDVLRKKKIMLPYLRNDDPYYTHRALSRILYRKY